ncbi:DUF4440 domain-containing protein [Sphingomonas oleivorans]|uniref:DUF4440 domain-containing protein n=1 Tax=Sphingomonas oleivorans TaxID=1735121 RepID=A0A2T5FV62_9SPHN|nr:oxalurate catabolism protein HpxZ [Sphingomonas oleivorans]PTQ08613.1 DUF4440 domain-containing protein [Sphingomonas oleivorans]
MVIDDPETLAALAEEADRYEAALMANDVDALDDFFWNSERSVRFGVGENLYGFAEIAAFRQARPGGSPQRSRIRTSITSFGRDFGVVNVEFQREGATAIGRQSQTWVRFPDVGWKIVSAHVSLMGGSH